jgi:hypothetical protein
LQELRDKPLGGRCRRCGKSWTVRRIQEKKQRLIRGPSIYLHSRSVRGPETGGLDKRSNRTTKRSTPQGLRALTFPRLRVSDAGALNFFSLSEFPGSAVRLA